MTCDGRYGDPKPNLEAPPTPLDGSVTIGKKGGGVLAQSKELACLWFGGFAGAGEVARRKAQLAAAVARHDEWEACEEDGEAYLLQYNDPFTPPWARRNEVSLVS